MTIKSREVGRKERKSDFVVIIVVTGRWSVTDFPEIWKSGSQGVLAMQRNLKRESFK